MLYRTVISLDYYANDKAIENNIRQAIVVRSVYTLSFKANYYNVEHNYFL